MLLLYFTEHRLEVLDVDQLVNEAIEANKNNEMMEVEVKTCDNNQYMSRDM